MYKEPEKQYFVQVENRKVEVSKEVYLELYQDQLYEKNQQRKRRRNSIISFDAVNEEKDSVYDFVPDKCANTEEEAIHKVTIHKIKEILKEIDKDNIILLKYLHEYSENEIAAVLGISQAAVSKKMQKVMEILRSFVL